MLKSKLRKRKLPPVNDPEKENSAPFTRSRRAASQAANLKFHGQLNLHVSKEMCRPSSPKATAETTVDSSMDTKQNGRPQQRQQKRVRFMDDEEEDAANTSVTSEATMDPTMIAAQDSEVSETGKRTRQKKLKVMPLQSEHETDSDNATDIKPKYKTVKSCLRKKNLDKPSDETPLEQAVQIEDQSTESDSEQRKCPSPDVWQGKGLLDFSPHLRAVIIEMSESDEESLKKDEPVSKVIGSKEKQVETPGPSKAYTQPTSGASSDMFESADEPSPTLSFTLKQREERELAEKKARKELKKQKQAEREQRRKDDEAVRKAKANEIVNLAAQEKARRDEEHKADLAKGGWTTAPTAKTVNTTKAFAPHPHSKATAAAPAKHVQMNETFEMPTKSTATATATQAKAPAPTALPRPGAVSSNSYNLTPLKGEAKPLPPKNINDYGIDEVEEDDPSDDDEKPKKRIPVWARNIRGNPSLECADYVSIGLRNRLFGTPVIKPSAQELF